MVVILGSLHALVFLPVLLSLVGPPSLSRKNNGSGGEKSKWRGFFSVVDAEGVDDDVWVRSGRGHHENLPEVSMQATPHEGMLIEGSSSSPMFPSPNAPDPPDPEASTVTHVHASASFQAHAPFRP